MPKFDLKYMNEHYITELTSRVDSAIEKLGCSETLEQCKERLVYRNKKIKEKYRYIKQFTDSMQHFTMLELKVLGYKQVKNDKFTMLESEVLGYKRVKHKE